MAHGEASGGPVLPPQRRSLQQRFGPHARARDGRGTVRRLLALCARGGGGRRRGAGPRAGGRQGLKLRQNSCGSGFFHRIFFHHHFDGILFQIAAFGSNHSKKPQDRLMS